MGKGYLEMDDSQEEGGGGGLWCAINNAQKLTRQHERHHFVHYVSSLKIKMLNENRCNWWKQCSGVEDRTLF